MHPNYLHGRPIIGVLAGWQFYRTATNLSYLAPLFRAGFGLQLVVGVWDWSICQPF
jgi:hypothetical protein